MGRALRKVELQALALLGFHPTLHPPHGTLAVCLCVQISTSCKDTSHSRQGPHFDLITSLKAFSAGEATQRGMGWHNYCNSL